MEDDKPFCGAHCADDRPHDLDRVRERLDNLKECFRVSCLINSSLELEQVLDNIMSTSRTILRAESCSLMLVDEKSSELVFEVAQGPVAHKLKGEVRLKKGQGIAGHVYETGESVLIEDAYSDPRFNKDFDRMTGYHTKTILCVPLKIKDRVIGVSQIINKLDGSRFNMDDEENLSLLSINAAIAVENARLHREILRKQQIERDLAVASTIQLSFLPQSMPSFDGFCFSTHYQAAQEVGGDFFDFILLDGDRMGVLIGDVSGKGVASALFMAKLTSDFRLMAIREKDPERLVARINDRVCKQSRMGMFATLLYLILSKGSREVVYVNAGHLPPVVWNAAEDSFKMLKGGGPPAGVLPGLHFRSSVVSLQPGDCVLLATDGLVEARDEAGGLFGWQRLEEAVRSGGADIEAIKSSVGKALEKFVKTRPQADDTTVVLVGVREE
ncbi:MAG: GAF domain-containing SpoIIE family protein phosphatase [Syntrophobacteraceae bacterium]